jgi:hypothetical protein
MAVGVLGYFGRLVSPAFPSDLCRPLHLSYGTVPRNSLVFVYLSYERCSYVPSLRRRGVRVAVGVFGLRFVLKGVKRSSF